MMIRGYPLGVCSWSLRVDSIGELIARVRALELDELQLGLGWLLDASDETRGAAINDLRDSGLALEVTQIGFADEDYASLSSIRLTGGFVPDAHWQDRQERTIRAAELSAVLGARSMSLHVGFIPPSSDPGYGAIVERVRTVAKALDEMDVDLLCETGQETASELLQFLNDLNCRNVGINFDPANMILYGVGDPIEAVGILDRHIRHVHLKDAISSAQPGVQWGKEVLLGTGEVPLAKLFDSLDDIGYDGAITIETEVAGNRMETLAGSIRALKALPGA